MGGGTSKTAEETTEKETQKDEGTETETKTEKQDGDGKEVITDVQPLVDDDIPAEVQESLLPAHIIFPLSKLCCLTFCCCLNRLCRI